MKKVEVKEGDKVGIYDKRPTVRKAIKGEVARIREGETLGTEWAEILLDSGYKIVLK